MPVIVYSYVNCLVLHTCCYSLFILLFSAFSYLLLLFMHIVLLHELFPLLHTHSPWSRSDDPGFARPDIGRLFLMCRCSMRRYALREAWVLSLWFWYSCIFFFLLLFLDSCTSHLACHSIPVISWFYLLSLSTALFLSLFVCYHV